MRRKMIEKSCGTIPYSIKDGIIYYLLIKLKNDELYGFPKGHVELGENEKETAIRETMEETSLSVCIDDEFRHEISYVMSNGNRKNAVYFLADFKDQEPKHNETFEDFDYFILPFDEAYLKLSFENTKHMLKIANEHLMEKCIENAPDT
jgi:8-oxo-dGTP pyrophosphatase MutT (NUDIX family)